jgi:prepilin-type N-terminal cleavage/methylation domain-containing protein
MNSHPTMRSMSRGFSLTELLVVVAIMGLMLGVSTPPLLSVLRSSALNNAGRQLSGMLTVARTQAIEQNTRTRLVVAANWPGRLSENFRRISIWQMDPETGMWTRSSKWEEFPKGVLVDPDTSATTAISVLDDLTLNNRTTLTESGSTVEVAYVEFGPAGGLNFSNNTNPVSIRLVEGDLSTGAAVVNYKRPDGQGYTSNWLDIQSDTLTGRISFNKP